ncbi:MAG: LPD7 domain-containing protein [Pseudomonadota bacterium]
MVKDTGTRANTRKARAKLRSVGLDAPGTPENSIALAPSRRVAQAFAEPAAKRDAGASSTLSTAPPVDPAPTPAPKAASKPATGIPSAVQDRFLRTGRQYFFPDGAPAFRDLGERLTTRSENSEVIRTLVQIALARGWQTLRVAGTDNFRRLAWEAGIGAGIAVRGYAASAGERARVDRKRDGAHDAGRPGGRVDTPVGESAPRLESAAAVPAGAAVDQRGGKPPLIQGELLAHGRATYKFQAHEQQSYFVRVKTREGERTLWGLDLERALVESSTRPKIGDPIGLLPNGRERVTVGARDRDAEGRVVGDRALKAHRNRWIVERTEFFEARSGSARTLRDASIPAATAVERHPELADAYLHVRTAEVLAQKRMALEADRKRFVALVREALASATARGEELPRAQLQPRGSRARHPEPKPINSRQPESLELTR